MFAPKLLIAASGNLKLISLQSRPFYWVYYLTVLLGFNTLVKYWVK